MAEEKKKRPVAHQETIRLLKEDPLLHLGPTLKLYERGTKVPSGDCLRFSRVIWNAAIEVRVAARRIIENIKEQRKESIKEGETEKKT